MKILLFALYLGIVSATQPLDEYCIQNFADLNICKLRGLLVKVYDELNKFIGTYQDEAYAYHSSEPTKDSSNFLFEKVLNDRMNAAGHQQAQVAQGSMTKRKSAFVRFGKRSELVKPLAQTFPSDTNTADNVSEGREVAKLKGSYIHFG